MLYGMEKQLIAIHFTTPDFYLFYIP
jgi:hypothetical protein